MDLKDKIFIVTGSAQGIGMAIAKRYIQDGAKVAIADMRIVAAEKTAKELTKIGPGQAIGIEMDVTDEDAVNAGVQKVVD